MKTTFFSMIFGMFLDENHGLSRSLEVIALVFLDCFWCHQGLFTDWSTIALAAMRCVLRTLTAVPQMDPNFVEVMSEERLVRFGGVVQCLGEVWVWRVWARSDFYGSSQWFHIVFSYEWLRYWLIGGSGSLERNFGSQPMWQGQLWALLAQLMLIFTPNCPNIVKAFDQNGHSASFEGYGRETVVRGYLPETCLFDCFGCKNYYFIFLKKVFQTLVTERTFDAKYIA